MWSLRKPSEISEIICIPIDEPFTIGRIESSLNITDDKSVSRRHASISVNSNLILTDCNSKFGTFVNGVKLDSGCTFTLKSGDSIKFGGAGSEFILELKNMDVYFAKTCNKREFEWIEGIAMKFGFKIVDEVKDAPFFILNDSKIDCHVVLALLLGKCIVSPDYFRQFLPANNNNSNNTSTVISIGLIQPPSITGFSSDFWLPRRERLNIFKSAFEGISRFVFNESEADYATERRIIEAIAKVLEMDTRIIVDYKSLKFNEILLTISPKETQIDKSQLSTPIRTISYQSILDALFRSDSNLILIETLYPEIAKIKNETKDTNDTLDTKYTKDKKYTENIGRKENILGKDDQTARIDNSKILNTETIRDETINFGPSKTAVIPFPSSLLRPATSATSASISNTNLKVPKFVKCHPRHRQPGTIPALIGPDQLSPTSSIIPSTTANNNNNNTSGVKRRILVKDSWLAEDEERDEIVKIVKIKENLSNNSRNTLNNFIPLKSTIPKTDSLAPQSNLAVTTTATTTTAANTKTTSAEPATSTAATTSTTKFQSSFFKNLSKGK